MLNNKVENLILNFCIIFFFLFWEGKNNFRNVFGVVESRSFFNEKDWWKLQLKKKIKQENDNAYGKKNQIKYRS